MTADVDYHGDYPEGFEEIESDCYRNGRHLGGVWWYNAPIPSRWHRCKAQTVAWLNYFDVVERCACGGLRHNRRGLWIMRNDRRKKR